MPSISENSRDDDGDHDMSESAGDIDDMLDEALDDSGSTNFQSEGPTPPKHARTRSPGKQGKSLSPTQSAASWEYETPVSKREVRFAQCQKWLETNRCSYTLLFPLQRPDKFKTPLVEAVEGSPQGPLPEVEGEEGSTLLHTVSFYRRQKPSVTTTPHQKIVRRAGPMTIPEEGEDERRIPRETIQQEIRKLQDESEEQRQRMEQASKALNFCVSQVHAMAHIVLIAFRNQSSLFLKGKYSYEYYQSRFPFLLRESSRVRPSAWRESASCWRPPTSTRPHAPRSAG